MTSAFALMATKSASTKRLPAVSGGQGGAPQLYLVDVPCLPLDPVDDVVRARVASDAAHTVLETTIEGMYDVCRGDVLVYDGREYPIRECERRQWQDEYTLAVRVEEMA